jgi:hypothetical protein
MAARERRQRLQVSSAKDMCGDGTKLATAPWAFRTAGDPSGVRHFALDPQKFLRFSPRMGKIVTFRRNYNRKSFIFSVYGDESAGEYYGEWYGSYQHYAKSSHIGRQMARRAI